jgi:hypothetical protein
MSKFDKLFSKGDERIINASRENFAKVLGHGRRDEDKH